MKPLQIQSAHLPSMMRLYAKALLKANQRDNMPVAVAHVSALGVNALHHQKFLRFFELESAYDTNTLCTPYAQVMTQKAQLWFMTRPSFPFKPMGLVHLGVQFEQDEPLQNHDVLDATIALQDTQDCRFGVVFNIKTTLMRHNRIVFTLTNTYLNRAIHTRSLKPMPTLVTLKGTKTEASHTITYPSHAGRRYGCLSGDINPIHLSALSAKPFGFKRAMAHGMYSVCTLYANTVRPCTPLTEAHKSVFQFKYPIWLPSMIRLKHSPHPNGQGLDASLHTGNKTHVNGQFTW